MKLFLAVFFVLRALAADPMPPAQHSINAKVWLYFDKSPAEDGNLAVVFRKVGSQSPLRDALQKLIDGPTPEEKDQGFGPIDFHSRLAGLNLKDGTLLAKFSGAIWAGTVAPQRFEKAVTLTAMQFPIVKKVIVCMDERANFGSADKANPPRPCPRI